jgi:hypothetical protein
VISIMPPNGLFAAIHIVYGFGLSANGIVPHFATLV